MASTLWHGFPLWVWAAFGLGLLFAAWVVARRFRRESLRQRAERARRGEARAAGQLVRAGFRLVGREVPGRVVYRVNGRPSAFSVRADYVVERAGLRYVAEVKTGSEAPRLDHSGTRRQLLEYHHAFGADGLLLVAPEEGRITHFAVPHPHPAPGSRRALVWVGLCSAALGYGAAHLPANAVDSLYRGLDGFVGSRVGGGHVIGSHVVGGHVIGGGAAGD